MNYTNNDSDLSEEKGSSSSHRSVDTTFLPLFKTLMQHSGRSQKEFAEASGCSPSLISDVLNERRGITEGVAKRWASVLGLEGEVYLLFMDLALLQNLPHATRAHILEALDAGRRLRQAFRDQGPDSKLTAEIFKGLDD